MKLKFYLNSANFWVVPPCSSKKNAKNSEEYIASIANHNTALVIVILVRTSNQEHNVDLVLDGLSTGCTAEGSEFESL
jgi:hypothetical protein